MCRWAHQYTSQVLMIVFGLAGCARSGPDATAPPQTTPAQNRNAPKSAPDDATSPDRIAPLMAAHYRGLGFIERYDYEKAEEAFQRVHDLAPGWIPGSVNLAIALMYQNEGVDGSSGHSKGDQALTLLESVVGRNPQNLHAHYCRGLIFERMGLLDKAHAEFQAVVANDPDDAHAWYMLGSTVGERVPADGKSERIRAFRRALECNPYLMAAAYKLGFAHRDAGDLDATKKQFALFNQLHGGADGTGAGDDTNSSYYGDLGRYAQVINPLADIRPLSNPVRPPRFEAPAHIFTRLPAGEHWAGAADFTGQFTAIQRARARFGVAMAAFDVDGNGLTDLYLAAAVAGPHGVRDVLLLNKGNGEFEDATKTLGLPTERASLGVAAGDFDADGLIDLFLTGVGDNRLYKNQGESGFKDITKALGSTETGAVSLTARWLDLDQDGDLDLYVVNYTAIQHLDQAFTDKAPPGFANAVYRNDGTPLPVPGRASSDSAPRAVARDPGSASSGLSIKLTPWTGADALKGGNLAHTGLAWLDLDDDHDLDLVVSAEGAVPLAILNDRLGRFRTTPVTGVNPRAADSGLLVTDLDQDGHPDLVALNAAQRLSAWKNQTPREPGEVTVAFERWPSNAGAWRSAFAADLDLDGLPDLLGLPTISNLSVVEWARNDGVRLSAEALAIEPDNSSSRSVVAVALADMVGDALPDLVIFKDGDVPRIARNLGNGHHWLSLVLNGRWASFGRLKSNPHGIGARIWLQGPGLSVIQDVTTCNSGLVQSHGPITLGLGEKEAAAVVRVGWPDGVSQSELNMPTD
jgi:FG-GAP-like repeat/ASPIC and UnbV/Tetratricopeptide repeat